MEELTLSGWTKKEEVVSLKLPSGSVIKIKARRLGQLARANLVPLSLLGDSADGKAETMNQDQMEDTVKSLQRINALILEMVVWPKLITEGKPKKDEFLMSLIPDEDMTFITSYIMGTEDAEKLKPFRAERESDSSGSHVQEVRSVSVAGSGDR